jgi:hypothetical protein
MTFQKVGLIAEIEALLMTQEKNWIHSMLCRLSRQKRPELPLLHEPGEQINLSLKQGWTGIASLTISNISAVLPRPHEKRGLGIQFMASLGKDYFSSVFVSRKILSNSLSAC